MKRTQVIIAINLDEYISHRPEALDKADEVALMIEKLTGMKAYGIDADTVEIK